MSSASSVQQPSSAYVETLRRERDRFVALAFCAADVLLEIGREFEISYAAGATVALTGAAPDDLIGRSFLDIVAPEDRPLLRELIRGMSDAKRLEPLPMRLIGPRGPTPQLLLTGYLLPDLPQSMFFALRLAAEAVIRQPADDSGRDAATGLYRTDSFVARAGERLRLANSEGDDIRLTMVRLQDFDGFHARLDEQTGESLVCSIAACLRVKAVPGDTVGRFDAENFGLLHRPDADIADLEARIAEHLKSADPAGAGIPVAAATVSAGVVDVSQADIVKALTHAIRRFCEDDNAKTALGHLSNNLQTQVRAASQKISYFRDIVSASNFDVAFQPIVRIDTREVSHFEALARFGGGSDRSPYELITFAENTGLICDFDFAMCRKLLDWLAEAAKNGLHYDIAVNLSGYSVENTRFLSALQKLLESHGELRKQLIIEITESARISDLARANKFIQSLRKSGHIVCLDDFGAGAAALRYLYELDVDVVKIDGQYIQGALKGPKMHAFLRAISGLCGELGITTVAEMVEDSATVDILKDCGVEYGQGFLFGRPSLDIGDFGLATAGQGIGARVPPAPALSTRTNGAGGPDATAHRGGDRKCS